MNQIPIPLAALAVVSALASLTFTACNQPGAEPTNDANQTQADVDKMAADARTEAEQNMRAARLDADKKSAEAEADFTKTREDYRLLVQSKLADLDKTIAVLDAKAKAASGNAKTEMEARYTSLQTRRSAFTADFGKLDSSTASTWDATKAHLDESWSDLKAAVDHAV